MKKLFLIFVSILIITQTVFASNIEVLPTMQSKTNVQDRVWVGTFQLVWNDFMDKYVHGIVKFIGGTPEFVEELNKQEITTDDVNDKCFYKYSGKITANTKKTIENAIKKKFNETSDLLDQLDLTPASNRFIIYTMLKKDFKFLHAFDKLGKSNFRDTKTEFFGINNRSNEQLREGVNVLFYYSDSDYAVSLKTADEDEVFLYRTPNTKTFNYIYSDMLAKQKKFNGKKYMANKDELKIPDLKFSEEKEFSQLAGKRVKGTRLQIEQALETVKFEMNNEGVKLKSEAGMTMKLTSAGPGKVEQPRYFYFDDTFVLFIKEKNKANPYFALRVHNISNFQ